MINLENIKRNSMNKMKKILLPVLFLLGFVTLGAQEKGHNCKFDTGGFKTERAEYFTKELKLTENQAQQFIPMLDEFMTKKFQVNKDAREKSYQLRKKTAKTETDYRQATEAFLDAKLKEAQLQKEYYKKFETVLSAEQIYSFSRVEMNFMRMSLKNHERKNKRK